MMSLLEVTETQDLEAVERDCYHSACEEKVTPGTAVHFQVGISHYQRTKGFSYIQVHEDMFSCSLNCAAKAAHERLDVHKDLQHGVFDKAKLNPSDQHADALVRQNAEYSDLPRAWASLPKVDCLTGQPLADDIYIPHVDCFPAPGCYQALRRASDPGPKKSLEQYDLGCSALEGAIQAARDIVNGIYEGLTGQPFEVSEPEGPSAEEVKAEPESAQAPAEEVKGETDPALPAVKKPVKTGQGG